MSIRLGQRDTLYHYRKELVNHIGSDVFGKLQKSVLWIDLTLFLFIISAFLINGYFIATLSIGFLWIALFVLQGFIIQWFPFFAHDAFTHRKIGGKYLSYIGNILFMLPIFTSPTAYREIHMAHHFYLNTAKDTEEYKLDLNSRWKKFFFLTFPGLSMVTGRLLRSSEFEKPLPLLADAYRDKALARKLIFEKIILVVFILSLILCSIFQFNIVIYGYILPVLLILPVANLIRVLLEHGDVDPNNPIQCGTYYKPGLLLNLLFLYNAGSHHFIHHIFPNVPFYKVPQLVKHVEPYLIAQKVRIHHSLPSIIHAFFIRNWRLRSPLFNIDEK